MTALKKLTLPRIIRVQMNKFSLFALQPNIGIDVPEGLFCLAGANGLGKSTFLAAVGYGLTGIVPNPRVNFRSVETYYSDCLNFSKDFFDGRISAEDRGSSYYYY